MVIAIRSLSIICIILFIAFFVDPIISNAATSRTHNVGLRDQMLEFSEIHVIDKDTKVPLEEMVVFLEAKLEQSAGTTYIRKDGIEITYNENTKSTMKDGILVNWSPIVRFHERLFISVKYIAKELGYTIEYFEPQKTQRLYKSDWKQMTHKDFESYLNAYLLKKQTPPKPPKANVYLTFDDGPNKYTAINNTTLKKYDALGTFFFLGNHMKKNATIIKSVQKDGHYIATHSMTHDKNKLYSSANAFIKEMKDGIKLIKEMTGIDTKLVRTPYGSKPHITNAMKNELVKNGYKLWDWDVDSNDWRYTDKQADQIVNNVRVGVEKAFKNGDRDIVILLHDRSQTTKALPYIIEWLQKEGYTLKTYEPTQHTVQNFLKNLSL